MRHPEDEQRLSFAYDNLALTSNHRPSRAAFKKIATRDYGWTDVEFDEWADGLEWRELDVARGIASGALELRDGFTIHGRATCVGPCPFHSPSAHKMRDWPIVVRENTLVERTCSHGIGHPDPDSVRYFDSVGRAGYDVHGCDGCCRDGGDA